MKTYRWSHHPPLKFNSSHFKYIQVLNSPLFLVLIKTTIGKNICFIFYCLFGILGQPQGKREVLGYLNKLTAEAIQKRKLVIPDPAKELLPAIE